MATEIAITTVVISEDIIIDKRTYSNVDFPRNFLRKIRENSLAYYKEIIF